MTAALSGIKIAIIAADGFDENHMTAVQRALTSVKSHGKVIAPEQGLVNGWQGNGWGHYFPVDVSISAAMGSDYDALILVGGERSVGELGASAGIEQPSLSQQLGVLRGERLVATRREGKQVIYRIASPAALTVLEALHGLFCEPAQASVATKTGRAPGRSPTGIAARASKKIA